MKAILIDVNQECVRSVDVNDDDVLHSMYKHLNCTLVDRVRINSHDDIWVDDEGLLTLTPDSKFFTWKGYDGILAGNGLILGCDEMGESVDPCITIDEVRSKVKFHTYVEVYLMTNTNDMN